MEDTICKTCFQCFSLQPDNVSQKRVGGFDCNALKMKAFLSLFLSQSISEFVGTPAPNLG